MKKELLETLKEALFSTRVFSHIDFYEKIAYTHSDYPICVIKDSSDSFQNISSDVWCVESSIEIAIINDEAFEAIDLANEVLKAICNLSNETFIYEIESIEKESEFLEGLNLKTTLHLKVKYYLKRFHL